VTEWDAGVVKPVGTNVEPGDLEELGAALLRAAGMAASEAVAVAAMLVETSMHGTDSHGVMRLPVYARRCMAGGIVSPARIERLRDDGGVVVLDGGAAAGHVVGARAVEEVTARASATGIAAVAVRNGNHLGALALYSRRIAERGQIGVVMTNASPRIAPTGGFEALLGNNPWTIGVPHPSGPLVMDVAQSIVAVGKIRMAKAAGEQLPTGWARDKHGAPTTDPDAALEGLVEPIGGHKGYGLVFMIDVLCAVLSGAASGPAVSGLFALDRPSGAGHLFMALDIGHFTDPGAFAERLDLLVGLIRSSGRAPGVDVIHLPGDLERLTRERRLLEGIPLSAAVRADLAGITDELGIDRPVWLAHDEPEEQ